MKRGICALVILALLLISLNISQPRPFISSANSPVQDFPEADLWPNHPNEALCPALPPPTGDTITITSEADLRDQAYSAAANTTLLVAAGTYHMQGFVQIVNQGITLRGATGNRDDVILDFGGMSGGHFGIQIDADDVTIADLTIRNANDHGVSIQGRDRPVLYNLHIQDIGDQLVKVNPAGNGSEDGLLACSRLEYTTTAPDDYTNGISAHNAHRWVVRDNAWYRIRTLPGTDPVPTILFWSASSDTIVERNLLVDCARGIAFGNSAHDTLDHTGGIVRNNMIYASMPHDVVIEMVHATGWLVANNTTLLLNPVSELTWGMEARFGDTAGTFAHNLSNMDIWPDREGAQGTSTNNITNAQASWFTDAASADLHLQAAATTAIDQADPLTEVTNDFDGDARPIGSAPDIGADEYGEATPVPQAVTDLQVSQGITTTDTLTFTLRWTPVEDAVTVTVRYADARITDANWDAATVLSDALTGKVDTLTGTLSYTTFPLYFALKSQNQGGQESALSNPAYWPPIYVYLPLVLREG